MTELDNLRTKWPALRRAKRVQQIYSAAQITLKIRRRGVAQQLTYQLVDR